MKVTGINLLVVGAVLMLLIPDTALASDPDWRPRYDIAMRWINFLILVAVIVKYSKEPIKDFLALQKKDVVSQIEDLDGKKARILDEIRAVERQDEKNRAKFTKMRERLIAQGEKRKQQLIQQARQQSTMMLEDTRRKMENRIDQARAELKMELVDMAIAQAATRLPAMLNNEDNQRLLDAYMQRLSR